MKVNYLRLILAIFTIGMVIFISFWQLTHQVYASNQPLAINLYNQKDNEGKLVFGGSFTLQSGEVLEGDLVIMGGEAILQEGSVVDGAVVIFGGTLQADGEIKEELVSFGGQVDLGTSAVVESDAVSFGGNFNYAEGTEFGGELITEFPGPVNFKFSKDFDWSSISPSGFWNSFNPIVEVMWLFLRSFIWAAVTVIVMLFFDTQVGRISETVSAQPVISGGLGLLTIIVAPVLLIGLIITIIGIPLSLLLIFVLGLAWALGVISIGNLVGNRIARMFSQPWAKPVYAGAGTFTLTFVINGIGMFVPCVGWFIPAIVGIVGLGAVGLTRFGIQTYPVADNTGVVDNISANDQKEDSGPNGNPEIGE